MWRKLATGIGIIALIAAVAAIWLDEVPVNKGRQETRSASSETFTLSNEMPVVLIENHRVPAVSHTVWLRVGAADDPLGKSGLAHYHEHLMFKGTPSVQAGEYSQHVEELGGEFNAFTGADFTGFYINIAREHLEEAMRLESDRMQYLAPSDAVYDPERAVIIEERKSRIDSQPTALWAEEMQATLFHHHPYHLPIIGWLHEMQGLTAEDAKAFYRHYYHAGNMVLVVAGDITRAELEPLAEKYYGAIAVHEANQHQWVEEPPQRSARTLRMTHPEVQQPRWQRRYVAPSFVYGDTAEAMPLSLLSEWLGGSQTSLFYQQLVVEQKLATAISVTYSSLTRGPSQFIIVAIPADGVSLNELETAIDKTLRQVRDTLIDPESLARIKTLFKAESIYERDGLEPIAQFAGYLTMLDLPLSYIDDWPDMVEAVTAEQIQAAARAVIQPQQSVTGYLLPEEAGE